MRGTISIKHAIVPITALIIVSVLSSCSSYVLKKLGVYDEGATLERFTSGHKVMYFIPMHHVGTPGYYQNVSKKIDSLHRLGYVTFFEGTQASLNDGVDGDLIQKKLRKIVGNFEARNGYLDTVNNVLFGRFKNRKDVKLINQPAPYALKIDPLTSVNADVTMEQILYEFEKDYGSIKLDDCDYNTHLDSVYDCKTLGRKIKKKFFREIILDFRNKHLAQLIDDSKEDKILVIYGAAHLSGLTYELFLRRNNWRRKW